MQSYLGQKELDKERFQQEKQKDVTAFNKRACYAMVFGISTTFYWYQNIAKSSKLC